MGLEGKKISPDFLKKYKIDECINSFANACELYSTVLDINGSFLVEPSGPTPYLGEFYVNISNPKYYQDYLDIVSCMVNSGESTYYELDDDNPESRYAAAPLYVDGTFIGTWILYAHNKIQNQKLFKSFDSFSQMAKSLSYMMGILYSGSKSLKEDKMVRAELEFEKQSKALTNEILDAVMAGEEADIDVIYEKVGKLLNVDYMVFYEVDDLHPGHMNLVDYWAKEGKSEEAEKTFGWEQDHYSMKIAKQIMHKGLVIDKNNMTNQMRVQVFKGNAKAVMVYPVYVKGEYRGRLIFIENTRERVWNETEIYFAKEIANIISRRLTADMKVNELEEGWQIVKSMAETLPHMVMVRSLKSGKVIYANAALKEKMGADVIGRDIRNILPIQDTKYEEDGASSTGTHYQKYIDELGDIYDITESYHKWGHHNRVSIVLMTPPTSF